MVNPTQISLGIDTSIQQPYINEGGTWIPASLPLDAVTIADLRLLTPTAAGQNAVLSGYYAEGDGGGGQFYGVVSGGPYTDNGGTIITPGGVAGSATAWLRFIDDTINVKAFGAKGDNSTNDTAAIQKAINVSANKNLYFPPGTYRISQITGINNISINGAGINATTIKSIDGNTVGALVFFNTKNNFSVSNITFDGNKTNLTSGSNIVGIVGSYNWSFSNCKFTNAKELLGYGSGISVSSGANAANNGFSKIVECIFLSNGGTGLLITSDWNLQISQNIFDSNGGAGFTALNYVFPPQADTQVKFIVSDNFATNNTQSGIVFSGYTMGGSSSYPAYGPGVPTNDRVIISGNICEYNGHYGLAFQGSRGIVSNNLCVSNNTALSLYGGILFQGEFSVCSNNVTSANYVFGIDAGGCSNCVISQNVSYAENTSTGQSVPINIGAAYACTITGNQIYAQGTSPVTAISCTKNDSDGAGNSLVYSAYGNKISDNFINMTANTNVGSRCIILDDGVPACVVSNNTMYVNDPNYSLTNLGVGTYISNNSIGTSSDAVLTLASASTLTIPDAAGIISITGTTTINNIYTNSQVTYSKGVIGVTMTSLGSGYSIASPPSVVFTGGGYSTIAVGTPAVTGLGTIAGVYVSTAGTGYTSAPIVSFTGGGGAGAAGTALVQGINWYNNNGMIINLLIQGSLTVNNTGNIKLAAPLVITGGGFVSLMGNNGNWYPVL